MTEQIPLSRIHSAARVIGASRGAVGREGIRIDTCANPAQSDACRRIRRRRDQRSGTVRTKVAISTPGFCLVMPALDM